MNPVKIVEIFYSIQGEGKLAGKPSIFVRFFGCTLNCPGFGVHSLTLMGKLREGIVDKKEDYKNWEVEKIAKEHLKEGKYKSLEELPLTKTGCDSYCSWHLAFQDLTKEMTYFDVADEIVRLEKEHANRNLENTEIVFTGGEPLLYQGFCAKVCSELRARGASKLCVTFETNGTVELSNVFKESFFNSASIRTTFSVSPKLKNSGCSEKKAFKPGIVATYFEVECAKTKGDIYLKFVIDDPKTLSHLKKYVNRVSEELGGRKDIPIYLMPAGGQYNETYLKNCQTVAKICMEKGYNYSPRLQVDLFKNKWGS